MASEDQLKSDIVFEMKKFEKSFTLKVIGYSLTKRLFTKTGNAIKTDNGMVIGTFDLGGHEWAIGLSILSYVPYSSYLTLHVSLLTETKTRMSLKVEFRLLDQKKGTYSNPPETNAMDYKTIFKQGDGIMVVYMRNYIFEELNYLKDDSFMLKCSAQLVKPVCVNARKKRVIIPSSDFLQHFNQLWNSREGADVVFQVSDKTFSAHKTVLAARSPVFKAEFFGSMQESKDKFVMIEDIKPEVFELMLHFAYNDTLPANEEVSFEMTQDLLVAADRYAFGRLKLICEGKLGDCIDVQNALEILNHADHFNCHQLKEICLDFLLSCENLPTDRFRYHIENCPLLLGDMLDRKRESN